MLQFIRNCQTTSKGLYHFSLPAEMYESSTCPKSSQHFLLSVFLILDILEGMKCYLIVVLICISLIIKYCASFHMLIVHL